MKRQSLYFSGERSADLRDEQIDRLSAGQVTVKTLVSAISAGTEMLFFRGQAPPDLTADSTIASLSNTISYPMKYGYCAVGEIIDTGPDVARDCIGRRVFAFNPHETLFQTDLSGVIPLPDGISPEAAVFLPNMETAVNFLMDGRPMIGDQVVVVGQGIVGLLTTALLCELPLASLVTLDQIPLRREWSQKLGATASLDPAAPGTVDEARSILSKNSLYAGADLTYELTGVPQALDLAIALTGFDGAVIIGSWYGQKRAEVDLGGYFHRSRIRLVSSQVSTINPAWAGRWSKERRFSLAWEMLRRVKPEQLITHRVPFASAPDAYHMLDQAPEDALQVVLTYP